MLCISTVNGIFTVVGGVFVEMSLLRLTYKRDTSGVKQKTDGDDGGCGVFLILSSPRVFLQYVLTFCT